MGKKNKSPRLSLTLTPDLLEKLNSYILKLHNKLGRLPHGVPTKLARMALEEWFDNHQNDFSIDWESRE